jgi:hypothetical protein
MSHGPPAKKLNTTNNNEEEDNEISLLPIPPDGGWGWMVVLASFAIHIVSEYIRTSSFPLFCQQTNVHFLDSRLGVKLI